MSFLAPNARYVNVGLNETTGQKDIRAGVERFLEEVSNIDWRIDHISESRDGTVLTERTDIFQINEKSITIPLMGVFEFEDGLIVAWRDYFDVPGFIKQKADASS